MSPHMLLLLLCVPSFPPLARCQSALMALNEHSRHTYVGENCLNAINVRLSVSRLNIRNRTFCSRVPHSNAATTTSEYILVHTLLNIYAYQMPNYA